MESGLFQPCLLIWAATTQSAKSSLRFPFLQDASADSLFSSLAVEEGPVFAMCMAGAGDQATLAKWIVGLQETNPVLSRTPVVFRLTPGPRELQAGPDVEESTEEEMGRSQQGSRES